jgi:hypothetical protein
METLFLNTLKENRTLVENRFNSLSMNASITKKDFFQIVFDYFEKMSKVMIAKCTKSEIVMIQQLNKAINMAENKAHEESKKRNYFMMVRNQRTSIYNG